MKKLIYCALAFAAGLFATSCQQENLEPVAQENTVTYTVEVPGVATKAYGEGQEVNQLIYEVWKTDETGEINDNAVRLYQVNNKDLTPVNDVKTAYITLNLVQDQTYRLLLWAQVKKEAGFENYNTDNLTRVSYKYDVASAYSANQEQYDAFYATKVISTFTAPKPEKISLKRPFAQLNIATENTVTDYTVAMNTSKVVVEGVPTVFNVATSDATEFETVTFDTFAVPTGTITVATTAGTKDYTYAAMNYVFASKAGINAKVSYDINSTLTSKNLDGSNGATAEATISNNIPNVPLRENYRTNIVGNLLSTSTQYEIVVDADFETEGNGDMFVINDGLIKNINGDYEVSNENGLEYAIENLFAQGGNFYLTAALYDMTDYDVNTPSVPAGKVLNIYGETPVVTRAASDITAVTGVEIIGLSNLIDEVVGSASISGVKLSDDDAVLVNDATEGTLVVSNCEAETILPEGKGEVLEADKVENLAQLQAALVSGVKEINVAQTIVIAAGEEVEIDLNGKTVRAIDTTEQNFELIKNQGTLKIKNTVSETAVMTVEATHNNGWGRYSAVIANTVGGNLTVEGNIILEHLGGTDMAYGIDNLTNGKGTSAVTTIDGATVKSPYRAVRQFLNGTEATNKLTVKTGSKLYGNNKSIFFHDPSTGANSGELVVEEGAELYGDVYLFVTAGSTEWPVSVSIAASSLMDGSEVLSGNVPVTHSVVEDNGVWTVKTNQAKVGDVTYLSFAEAVAEAKAGDTITMLSDVTLSESLTLPAGITFNGNGKQINGSINAGGNLTFAGHTKVTAFSASYYNRTITIGEGACLEVTGGGRVSLAYGNTFNITGNIEDAKTADKANVQPSLIIPAGISITGGNDATMNVTNAYVKIGSTTSKPGEANGKFTLNFNNSIAEFTKEFGFYAPTGGKTPEFEMNIENSVFTTAAKLCVAASNSVINVESSNVTLGTYLRNSGEINLTDGSVLTGATIQFGENGGNDGSITVDNSSLTILGGSAAHAFDGRGVGCITAKNKAAVEIDYVKDMILMVGDDCTFTYKKLDNCSEVVTNAEELVAALAEGKNVFFANDITVAATKGGYNKAGILQNKAQTIDGNGHTLTVTGAGATWDCAIYTNGGLIKNLTVAGAMRGIFTAGQSSDLHIDNVVFQNVIYTFNSDGDMPANPFGVYVSNSTVNGWTSHSNMHTEVVYNNCSFGEGSGYKYCRPYGKTSFVECTFCSGYTVDESITDDITYTNCVFN